MTKYNTGIASWTHGQLLSSDESHRLLGPCPTCGGLTFDYGGGWRCLTHDCLRGCGNPAPSVGPQPDWWDGNVQVMWDGGYWYAYRSDEKGMGAGVGTTPQLAVDELILMECVDLPITQEWLISMFGASMRLDLDFGFRVQFYQGLPPSIEYEHIGIDHVYSETGLPPMERQGEVINLVRALKGPDWRSA